MAAKDNQDKKSKSKNPKQDKAAKYQQQIDELTVDLQRTRADFENYRKRMELEKDQARMGGKTAAVISLLPVIDNIERAITHAPADLVEHPWVRGITGLTKQLDKALGGLDLKRIQSDPGTVFNPDHHEAIQMDEEASGETEVIAEELQAGYLLADQVIRPALVKVTRR